MFLLKNWILVIFPYEKLCKETCVLFQPFVRTMFRRKDFQGRAKVSSELFFFGKEASTKVSPNCQSSFGRHDLVRWHIYWVRKLHLTYMFRFMLYLFTRQRWQVSIWQFKYFKLHMHHYYLFRSNCTVFDFIFKWFSQIGYRFRGKVLQKSFCRWTAARHWWR